MAVFILKCEELLRLIPDLQCHKCKNVPGPNGNQKNRYSCIASSHTLCEEHKTECLCGSKVGKSPSPVIANLLRNLPWICQNYNNGCREIKMIVEDLDYHQRNCIYRHVFCPNNDCEKGEKILFKDVIDHLKICLKEAFEERMLKGIEHKFDTCIDKYMFEKNSMENGTSWPPTKWTSTSGAVFFTSGYVENQTFYVWSCLLGSVDEAKKYSCTLSVTNEIGEKFLYSGPVHTLDKEYHNDIIASRSLLGIEIIAAMRSLNFEKSLPVEITIRNLKEEAKDDEMESGVSDDDMESSGVSDGD